MNKTTCSWSLIYSVTWSSSLHWSTWSQLIQTGFSFSISNSLFSQWLYFPVDLGCALIIFPVFHSSLPFILYSTTLSSLIFLPLSFNYSLICRLLLYCPPSFPRLHLCHFWQFSFLHSFYIPILCFLHSFNFQILCLTWMHPVNALPYLINTHWPSLPNTLAGPHHTLQFCLLYIIDCVTCHKFFLRIRPYIRSLCSPNFFTWFSISEAFPRWM